MATTDGLGLVVGLVVDLRDPLRLGRVKVRYPELGADVRSDWARLVTPMAGGGRGVVFRPEVGEEVVLGFLQGDPRAPYVLGGVWNDKDRPPKGDAEGRNDLRFITSRSGHVVRLDDTAGRERIEVVDRTGQCRVVIDSARKKVVVVAGAGGIELVSSTGTIRLNGKDVTIDATNTVKISGRAVDVGSTTSTKVKAGTTLSASGTQSTTIRGATVNIN
ncbi:phage baseplate assembly protein V [Saccharothrix syringae]|uniref:Phage tail protein n=1 Tax=Saccharothrix syringae TaxID=103733 RepID=A0A5Q0GX25_SACSY|nr:phage baseplate assembly protein V [Saccharothrix syringae]QFZ18656.1 phage tail protein [Saccharothrix syringae]